MKPARSPIPDGLRTAALALRQPPAPMPEGVNITVLMATAPKFRCEEAARQRVEKILRRPPRVIVTSRWTWEAPLGTDSVSNNP